MFKRLSIGQGFVIGMMTLITLSLIATTLMFYNYFNTTTAEIVKNSSREINKQVIMNYERYIDEVIATANYLERKTIELSEDHQTQELNGLYTTAQQMSTDMVSIVLLSNSGAKVFSSDSRDLRPNLALESWFYSSMRDREIFHFSSPQPQQLFIDSTKEVITVTKYIQYYDAAVLKDGILVIDLTTDNIKELAMKTNLGKNGHILILDEYSSFVFASTVTCSDSNCESKTLVDEIVLGGDSVLLDGEFMYLNVNTLKHTRWRIATFININNVYVARQQISLILFLVVITALAVSLMLGIALSNRISKPLNKLKRHMARVEAGDLDSFLEVEGQKEVVALSVSFNHMVDEIRLLMDRLLTEQKEKRKSEFLALQTQINPHFLYNTLDSIVWLAENNQNAEVIEMVIALSRFFRISISRGKNVISVKDELEHAINYLHIQKIRYNKKFDYTFDIHPSVYQYSVVKLILQPIIENAIHHGIHSEFESGKIHIKAYVKKNRLLFEIENNGYGITQDRIAQILESMRHESKANSVGLRNVYQRLKLYYGDEADVIITSDLDEMTNVKLIVPLRKDVAYEETH